MDNYSIARRLMKAAHELEGHQSNLYRIRAYRRAAQTVLGLDRPVEEIVAAGGAGALRGLPGIGSSLADKIVRLVHAGEFATLNAVEELATVS